MTDGGVSKGLLRGKYRYGRARGQKAGRKKRQPGRRGDNMQVPGTWEAGNVGIKNPDLIRVSVSDLEWLIRMI